MFHTIPQPIQERMRFLEALDRRDRADGTPRPQRLRQVTPETGKFIALLAACSPQGEWIEIGTSAGYSTLWLSLAARMLDRRVVTFEILPEKVALAQETFRLAEVDSTVELVQADARTRIADFDRIAFAFLDAEKEVYAEIYELVIPRLVKGGMLVADNAISHYEELRPVIERALGDERVDALVAPVGKGVLVCRKI